MVLPDKIWYATGERHADDKLSYVTYHEDNKAFEKRKQTGLSWANIDESEAIIIDNVLLPGYEILGDVSRWSTSNVVWRIKDPRGFVFEIYSPNMMEIIRCSAIKKGVIQDECILGFDKGKVTLLPKGSSSHLQALLLAEKKKNTTPNAPLIPFECYMDDKGILYQYLGEYYNIKSIRLNTNTGHTRVVYQITPTAYQYFKVIRDENGKAPCYKKIVYCGMPKSLSPVHNKVIDGQIENPVDYINSNTRYIRPMLRGYSTDVRGVTTAKDRSIVIEKREAPEQGSDSGNYQVIILQYGNKIFQKKYYYALPLDLRSDQITQYWYTTYLRNLPTNPKVFVLGLLIDGIDFISLHAI